MNLAAGWFVTGTDTGVGKTRVAAALIAALCTRGERVAPMKPVASGCVPTKAGLRSEDALDLLAACARYDYDYTDVNPYAFAPPVAPHLAALQARVDIRLDEILRRYARLRELASCVVVEGVGGWCVPLDATSTTVDLARALALPVILVVGVRLGCINHALLTQESIEHAGLPLAGWVANTIDADIERFDDVVGALRERISAPLIGVMPHGDKDAASNARHLHIDTLLP
jgi:dethiobiotin synthetase